MADPDFKFDFGVDGSQTKDSGPGSEGTTGTDAGNGSTTGPSVFDFSGITGSKDTASDSTRRIDPASQVKKRRGRQPYPRDAEGNIIRPDGTIGTKARSTTDKGGKTGLASVKNDREKLKQNIAGIHEAVATFLGFQNIVGIEQGVIAQQMLLSDEEATAMSNATADLFDRLGWNITGGGEGNIYIAAAMFAFTVYRIEGRRFAFLMALRNARNVTPLAASNTAEATARGTAPRGGMDFSGDIAATVNGEGNTNDGNGTYRYN